jgi:hypothetical protein
LECPPPDEPLELPRDMEPPEKPELLARALPPPPLLPPPLQPELELEEADPRALEAAAWVADRMLAKACPPRKLAAGAPLAVRRP